MGTVSGIGTTFNLPNFHGELITVTPTDTPLLSLSGGIGGGKKTTSTRFEWQTEDLRDPEIRARLEGADAPASEERSRANLDNVVQIFHESVSTSYTKEAATGQYKTVEAAPWTSADGATNPVADEHGHQVATALKTIARDVNYSFWHGREANPATNGSARQTGGLLEALTVNRVAVGEVTATTATDTATGTHAYSNGDKIVITDPGTTGLRVDRVYYVVSISTTVSFKVAATLGGSAITLGSSSIKVIKAGTALTWDGFSGFMQGIFDNGGISEQETATLFVSSRQKRAISSAFANEFGKVDLFNGTRNVGGVNVQTIETDFGTLNVVIERALAPDSIAVVSLEQIDPVFLEVPGKGVLFEEALATTGSAKKSQIYGEIGLKYGNPLAHGVYRGLAV
jgi:hypothetical protein